MQQAADILSRGTRSIHINFAGHHWQMLSTPGWFIQAKWNLICSINTSQWFGLDWVWSSTPPSSVLNEIYGRRRRRELRSSFNLCLHVVSPLGSTFIMLNIGYYPACSWCNAQAHKKWLNVMQDASSNASSGAVSSLYTNSKILADEDRILKNCTTSAQRAESGDKCNVRTFMYVLIICFVSIAISFLSPIRPEAWLKFDGLICIGFY